jgi:outer membrane protein
MRQFFKMLATILLLTLIAIPARGHEQGDWILRAGVGVVDPQGTAYTDPDDPTFQINIDRGTSATLTGAYMFSDNWAFEVLASWPFSHDINLEGVGKIAATDHLPPTFSLQYHFVPGGKFQPYAGLGVNYTTFFNTDVEPILPGATLDLDNSFGVAAQLGADMMLNDKWLLNFDFRWISIESDATLFDGVDSETVSISIDPLVYSVNLGYKF